MMPDQGASIRKQAQTLIQSGDFQGALATISQELDATPDDLELLYLAVVAARYARQFDEAHCRLDRLKQIQPELGRAFQEEGHLLRDQGRSEAAIKAYGRAAQFNPSLEASWRSQAKLLEQLGRQVEARHALAQADRVKAMPKHLIAATHHLSEGRVLKAEDLCRAFLKAHPRNVEAMRLLADIGTRLGVLDDAEILLRAAIELAPNEIQLRLDCIQVLRKRQKFAEALEEANALYIRDPDNPLFASHLAIESMQTGDYESALKLFDKVLEKLPSDAATLTSKGHALKTAGSQEDAIRAYSAAIASDPAHGDAWYALANLKTYTFSESELADLVEAESRSDLSYMARVHLCFALGKAFEDRKDYANAFEYFERGNTLKSLQTRYTTDQMREELEGQKSVCSEELFRYRPGVGHPAPDPIFIVGLPRAGSTLIEQILASHSQVDGTLELPNILSLAHRLRGRRHLTEKNRYPEILRELADDEFEKLGAEYIETTQIHRAGAPFFTDKMPNNFRHLGMIHMILPNAKIIDARRDPMDCCWSGFKQLFAEGQEFTYSLEDMGNYYSAYVDLMQHWDRVLPKGRILRVQHEDVLDDLEGQVRRILNYCGLPFEQTCVDFYKTDRAVRTASSEQVRRPINRSGQGQWRPYESYLQPLKSVLGSNGILGI